MNPLHAKNIVVNMTRDSSFFRGIMLGVDGYVPGGFPDLNCPQQIDNMANWFISMGAALLELKKEEVK